MKHVKRFLALSLAAALLAGCVSCGNSDEKTSPTGGGSGVDSTGDGGTLRIAMTCAALPNTDSEPTEGQEGYRFVSFQLYDALVKWDASSETEAGKIIPGLATSWEQNPENPKRWTFHLREGVKFHDGTDFNADCVIFALDRVMNPTAPPAPHRWAASWPISNPMPRWTTTRSPLTLCRTTTPI